MVGAAIVKAAAVKSSFAFNVRSSASPICSNANDLLRNVIPDWKLRDLDSLRANRRPEEHAHVVDATLELLGHFIARIPAERQDVGFPVLRFD
jgi:hypothetical protein